MTNAPPQPIQTVKSGKFYIFVFIVWLAALSVLGLSVYTAIQSLLPIDSTKKIIAIILISIVALLLSSMWLLSAKDLCNGIMSFFTRKKAAKHYKLVEDYELEFSDENPAPKVLIIYCTYNDFIPIALEKSMQQNYGNFETIILDDSTKPEYRDLVDEFAAKHNTSVIRREHREHYKAGALNNYLKNRPDADYFVVLDADEILPPYFIEKALKYFYVFEGVGIVQGDHKGWGECNAFMSIMGACMGLDSIVSGAIAQFYGQNMFCGHGALISKKLFDEVGGFPPISGEDSALTIEAVGAGYSVHFAKNVICYEQHPVDYVAYKKRLNKFVQADCLVAKKYVKKVPHMKMRWFQKLDLYLWSRRLTRAPLYGILILFALMTLNYLGSDIYQLVAIFAVFLIFLISPIIIIIIRHTGKVNFFKLLLYLLLSLLLYGSVLLMMVITIVKCMFGKKANFNVTAKKGKKFSIFYCLLFNYKEILAAVALCFISFFLTGSVIPVLVLVISLLSSIIFMFLSNIRIKDKSLDKMQKEFYIK